MNFVAALVNQGLKLQTIKCYLSAVRHLQIECGGGDPRVESMPLLALTLRGAKREQAGAPTRTRLPLTPAVLEKLRRVWNQDATNPRRVMLCGIFRLPEIRGDHGGRARRVRPWPAPHNQRREGGQQRGSRVCVY